MIRVDRLQKSYGAVRAADGISFQIEKGEAFGLLGPNGAGKTTTILMIAGVLRPDAGTVSIAGRSDPTLPEVRRALGLAPQELAVYEELTGAENLSFFGRLYGLSGARLKERVAWGLEFAGLAERKNDAVRKYSGGMKRRLNLACALVHEPEVLICDEPTVGVDPQSRNHIFEAIRRLGREGTTLIYTTHYMEEAERLCDRVAIVDRGRILALGGVPELIAEHGGASVVEAELLGDPPPNLEDGFEVDGRTLRAETKDPFEAIATLGRLGVPIGPLRVERPDLERVFLHLTGRRLRDE